MNKIIKYLLSLGVECTFTGSKNFRHIGGRSFYNDGWYIADFYEFSYNGVKYTIHHKSTGRPKYWLFINGKLETLRFNQRDFIALLERILQ